MKEELISKESFARATHLEKFRKGADVLMNLTGVNKINQLYKNALIDKEKFIDSIFEQLNIKLRIDESELKNIPKSGAFITISNHPFGALDGLVLLFLVTKVRPDFKVMANFLLKEIDPISDSFISVNPFENKKELASSIEGTKASISWLNEGHGLGIFPAGEVSSFRTQQLKVTDKLWSNSILKLIYKMNVPIVPIHFEGNNSLLFQVLGIIHPSLRTLALPSELLKKKHSEVKVRIGKVVPPDIQSEWRNAKEFGRFLRAKTYSLESPIQSISFFKKNYRTFNVPKIATAPSKSVLEEEIATLKEFKVTEQAEFELYMSNAKSIPNILNEIGRLREITFREVGEGSNKELDLDEYDLYYQHLFLWDKENCKVVGAYRLGVGQDIFAAYGKNGFYLNSLFKIKKGFDPILKQSIEMGRSFIVKEYQQKRLPLYMLWQGIVSLVAKNDNYKYLIGPVSISNNYTKLSRMLMVEFIRKFYFNDELARFVEPRKKFRAKFKRTEGKLLLEKATNDVKKFDHIISDIEPSHAPIPVLIKKYLKQNAKIIGFNLDPSFNNALDGFMILDIEDVPEDSIVSLKKDIL